MNERIVSSLNERQKEAVTAGDGPLLIVAGAGAGKTRALTHRLAYLIGRGVSAERIVALTFTNRAAEEMRGRVRQLLAWRSGTEPFIGTFHALGARILRRYANLVDRTGEFVIYDEKDRLALIKEILADFELSADRFRPGGLAATISRYKNELVLPAELAERAENDYEKSVGRIYDRYEGRLRSAGAVDFDDLLILPIALFERAPAVLEQYQSRLEHILVDEYQDTNHAQYVFLKYLAGRRRNLCVVGDDWQAIYGFRGANFRNVLEFKKDYPDATVVFLEENYRSTQAILDSARAVIEKNTFRTEKRLWTKKKGGEKVRVVQTETEEEEAAFVAEEIGQIAGRGGGKKIGVLYRTNAQSRSLEEALIRRSVPYKTIGSVRFWDRREVKDVIAYLRLLANPADALSLGRIINVPPRGIGKATLGLLGANPAGSAPARVRPFFDLLERVRAELGERPLGEVIRGLLKKIKYEAYLNDGTPAGEERWGNVQELLTVANKFDHLPGRAALTSFLEDIALTTPADDVDPAGEFVYLMTLHSAKGLEFDAVFIVGCEDGLFPHERSLSSPAELEEERRLCYVGLTRAKSRLYLVFTRRRSRWGDVSPSLPSRFLGDLPEHLVEFISYETEPIDVVEI